MTRSAYVVFLWIGAAALPVSCSKKDAASPAGRADAASTKDVDVVKTDAWADAGSTPDGSLQKDAIGGDSKTSNPCGSVAHIGDSLTAYTKPSLTAAYQAEGLSVQINAYGGRAILERLPEDPETGRQAAASIRGTGFSGCWVVALGTNDTANVAAGANHTRGKSIDEMMKAIDPTASARVMWVNTHSTKTSGYWSSANMELWNEALKEAQSRWTNLRIFDWATTASTGVAPYSDGLHHTSAGYEVRNKTIANALLGFFPN